MASYLYRSFTDLEDLGHRVVEKAAEVTMWQDESYSQAQQDSINDYTKSISRVTLPKNPHYVAPRSGHPEDNANVKAYVRSSLADVPSYFTAFSVPDPDSVNEALTEPLYRVAGTLVPSLQITRKVDSTRVSTAPLAGSNASANSVVEMVDIITTIHMKHWTGDAADEFTRYCLQFKEMAQLQNLFAVSLAEVMDAHLEIRRRQLNDIWNIGEKTIKTLDSLDAWCNGKKSSQNAITVFGAVAAVVVVATQPEVAAVAVGAEVIQSFATIMGTFPDQNYTEPADISGATVQAVIESMTAAIQKLHAGVDEQQQRLRDALTKLQNAVHDYRSKLLVEPPPEVTALATADVDTLRTTFVDR